ncbi:MAG: homoserine kinase [Acidobacteria bacterium]|nr:homoserine kinase [Acidobacteriota bacterium]
MSTRSSVKSLTRKPSARALELALPATSANLGPAFDAAALAFGLFLKISAKPATEFSLTASGRDAAICGQLDNHLIINTYRDILQAEGKAVQALALRLKNDVPIGKGCGSSATARLAGIALAVHFGGLKWNDSRIIGEASRLEHHPDNASACWAGGVTVARMANETEAQVARIVPKGKWPLLLAIPEEPLSTEEARRVLPAQYSRADAVINIQNSMLILAGLMQGRSDLLASALEDRIHQPYRAALCPLLPALQKLAGKDGVLNAVLSGAGPSVLVFLHPKANPAAAKKKIAAHLQSLKLKAELIATTITDKGGNATRL